MDRIKQIIQESIVSKNELLNERQLIVRVGVIVKLIVTAFKTGNKVLFCGNGGSAADAQHLAAEFTGRFAFERAPLPAEALHANTSFLTAVANDYDFKDTYARLVQGIGRKGDVLVAISTSGNSDNIINAIKTANKMGLVTVGFTGQTGGKMKAICRYLINVPSTNTPRVQEMHILIGHIICELVESAMFKRKVRK